MDKTNQVIFQELLEDKTLREELKKLALARIQVIPQDITMSIGGVELTKDQVLQHIQDGDEIGQQLVQIQWEFLKDLSTGAIYESQ